MKWIEVQEVYLNGCYCGYTEYISEDGTMGRQVWFDGEEEIYEVGKSFWQNPNPCYNKDTKKEKN